MTHSFIIKDDLWVKGGWVTHMKVTEFSSGGILNPEALA